MDIITTPQDAKEYSKVVKNNLIDEAIEKIEKDLMEKLVKTPEYADVCVLQYYGGILTPDDYDIALEHIFANLHEKHWFVKIDEKWGKDVDCENGNMYRTGHKYKYIHISATPFPLKKKSWYQKLFG